MNSIYGRVCVNLSKDWKQEWNSSLPEFPGCFQFFDAPLYLFLYSVLCIMYIFWLKEQVVLQRSIHKLCFLKIIMIGCLILLQICELIYSAIVAPTIPTPYYVSNGCLLTSLVIMLVIIIFEKRCNAMNSGFYFIYWVLYFSLTVIRSHSAALSLRFKTNERSNTEYSFIFFNLIFVTISLVLSCFSDKMTDRELTQSKKRKKSSKLLKVNAETDNIELQNGLIDKQSDDWNAKTKPEWKECPETYASFLSRISFYWFTPLVIKGYKRPLTNDDLWRLNVGDYCRDIVPTMLKHLHRYLVIKDDEVTMKDGDETNTNANSVVAATVAPPETDGTEKKLLEKEEKEEKEKPKEKFDPSLIYALMRTHSFDLLLSGIYKLIHDSLIFLGPLLLKLLLEFIAKKDDYIWKGYLFAALLLITAIIRTFILHLYFQIVFRIGMRVRSSVVSIIYRKSLVLSTSSRKDSTVGEIVNLMSVDAQKFLELTSYIHMLWSGPFQIVLAMFLLWQELGPSVLAGVAVMLLLIPINAVIGNMTRKIQTEQLKVSDQRIKLMNEILNGIKVLKLYAWELSFMKFITDIRNKELNFMRRSAYLSAAISFTFNCAPFIVSLTSFGMYVLISSRNILTAEKAFVSISLFNILRFPLLMLPMVISNLIQASVSLRRLTTFLKRGELDNNAVQHDNTDGVAASITDGSFSWDHTSKSPFLSNINVIVPRGHLVAIVGPVGAGKSSLLSALLGEIHKVQGAVNVNGTVAYVPQQAWIINATVRDNIIFGLPFDSCKYKRVLTACCLLRDLEILKDSDLTEIGEKGINLSGGQKQRISLARACYSDTELLLLDDPLSAVDSHVGKDLIDNVLGPNGMLANRTRILVTHNLTVLPVCNKVIVLENGVITEEGSYCELIKHAGAFSKFIAIHVAEELNSVNCNNATLEELADRDQILKDIQATLAQNNQSNSAIFSALSKSREKLRQSMESLHHGNNTNEVEILLDEEQSKRDRNCVEELKKMGVENVSKEGKKLIEEETSKVGNVRMAVYMAYFRSVGLLISFTILILFIITQAFSLGSNLWLVRWSSQSKNVSNYTDALRELESQPIPNKTQIDEIKKFLNHQRDVNLGIYGLFGLGQALVQLAGSTIFAFGSVRAADRLHQKLLFGVLHYPMLTFDRVPIGRIINRFSSDLNSLAMMLPHSLNGLLITILSSLSVFVMITLPNAWIILPLIFITIFYALMQVRI